MARTAPMIRRSPSMIPTGREPGCRCAECRRRRQRTLEMLIEDDLSHYSDRRLEPFDDFGFDAALDRETAIRPAGQPTPGHYYAIKRGDTLLGVAGRAYGLGQGPERLAAAQRINDADYNRRFRKANLTDKGLFPHGRISYDPRFSCDLKEQARKTPAPRGKCFATIWIPRLKKPAPVPGTPVRPTPLLPQNPPPLFPSVPPLRPRPPKKGDLLPPAPYADLMQLRREIRDDVWIHAEASSLLGGRGHGHEWVWTIYKVVLPKSNNYGVTPFSVGERRKANFKKFHTVLKDLGVRADERRVQLVEHGHTHPAYVVGAEVLSGIIWKKSDDCPSVPCGDMAMILMYNEPVAVITPRGKYILGSSRLGHPLGDYEPDRRKLKPENVHVEPILEGMKGMYRPARKYLKEDIMKKIDHLSTVNGISDRVRKRALSRLKIKRY